MQIFHLGQKQKPSIPFLKSYIKTATKEELKAFRKELLVLIMDIDCKMIKEKL